MSAGAAGAAARIRPLEPEADRAFAEHESGSRSIERRQRRRERLARRHHVETIVRLEEGLEDRVGAAGDQRRRAAFAQDVDGVTMAASPDASLWLTVMFGPRRR